MIAVGYGITKGGMLSSKTRVELTNVVLYVLLPCNIFNSFQTGISADMLIQGLIVLSTAFGLQILAFALNKFAYLRLPPERQIILKYTTITNNAAFLGLPILSAAFGSAGVLYGSIFLIPARIMMWTAGISLFTRVERGKRVKKVLTHPCMLAVALGFAYAFAPFELPAFASDAIRWVGECARVLPMLIVGSILSGVKLRDALDPHCFYFAFIRLVVMPSIMFGALALLRLDPLVVGVAVLMAAMPSATVSAMFAEKYGLDPAFASKNVFVSTMLSIITLPLIAAALAWLMPV